MSVKALERIIAKQTDITKLKNLRDSGISKLENIFGNFDESCKVDLVYQINERIRILNEVK